MLIQQIRSKIFEIQGFNVMLDFDLASMYEVENRALKQAVKRNLEPFSGRLYVSTDKARMD